MKLLSRYILIFFLGFGLLFGIGYVVENAGSIIWNIFVVGVFVVGVGAMIMWLVEGYRDNKTPELSFWVKFIGVVLLLFAIGNVGRVLGWWGS